MTKGRKSHAEQARQSLLQLWRGEPEFGRSIGCVATTYTFNAGFFEEECLARLIGMESDSNESAKAYLIEREEKLSQNFACVLVDCSQVSIDRSLRWHQLPVTLPGGGIQHSKLCILVWERHIRVFVASANLTEPAYRKNLEHVAVLEFSHDGGLDGKLLRECVAFVREVSRFAPGFERTEHGPQQALRAFLSMVDGRASSVQAAPASAAECFLIPLTREPRRKGVLEQLKERWRGSAPTAAWVLSPFYNDGAEASYAANKLAEMLTTRGHRYIEFTAIGRKLSDGTVQVDAPPELRTSSHPSLAHGFHIVDEDVREESGVFRRPLHAKSLWLERDHGVLFMVGSSNFTLAGFGLHPRHNLELNVGYLIRDPTSQFASLCRAACPTAETVDDPSTAQFLGSVCGSEGAEGAETRLHPAFGAALLRVDGSKATLELEIAGTAPEQFEILTTEREPIATSKQWREAERPVCLELPWSKTRLPSALGVRWAQDTEWREAAWIINVVDVSALPSPSELAELTLDELIAVLTSARPLHQMVMAMVDMRRKAGARAAVVESDPLRRVSTSHHLLKRMRRASEAFEGMRKRLEEPVHSLESLRWRLHGPVGPIAFATRLVSMEGSAGGFMIAELATTIRDVEWHRAGTLLAGELSDEIQKVMTALWTLARAVPGSESLAIYVDQAFREIAPL